MRYAESKLREEEQRAQKYLETSLCTNSAALPPTSIPVVAVGPQLQPSSQQPVTNGGGGSMVAVAPPPPGVTAGPNTSNKSSYVQNLVDSCVVSNKTGNCAAPTKLLMNYTKTPRSVPPNTFSNLFCSVFW